MIQFQGVSKSYGRVEAVRNLNLEVPPGELFGFLGPNGAGKTTTIKMATGMLRPSGGRVLVAGYDVYAQGPEARALIGYVPDTPYLYDKLTGREFLEFVADLYGIDVRKSRTRTGELLELFSLHEHAEQLVESYSHGMRQKLVIASVLIHDPQVIFLDEPTTALDPKSARLVKEILRTLCAHGVTVFMSTHVMEIAERMCDRVGIINHGELVALGTIDALQRLRGERTLEDVFLAVTGETGQADLAHVLEGGSAT
jgi:ABC-2 type transport system ATP-binding protein